VGAQAGFTREDAQWTHAGVFLYDDKIVEAVPLRGVRTRSLYEDIPTRILRVRRAKDLTQEVRYQIALRALSMMGDRYDMRTALEIGGRALFGEWDHPIRNWNFPPVMICSKVFHDACVDITHITLHGCQIAQNILPAHLSATESLEDVDIGWMRV